MIEISGRVAPRSAVPAVLVTALALLSVPSAALAQKAVKAQSKGVVVENDASQPVPTVAQGVSAVEGSVSARQEGPWSIAVEPSGPAEPFQATVTLEMNAGQLQDFETISLPPGRRLVVEHVSAHAALPNGQAVFQLRLDVLQAAGGSQSSHFLTMEPQGSRLGVGDYFAASQAMRVYAVGAPRAAAFRTDNAGFGFVEMTVSGYLVDP